jgi:hypothetical protein
VRATAKVYQITTPVHCDGRVLGQFIDDFNLELVFGKHFKSFHPGDLNAFKWLLFLHQVTFRSSVMSDSKFSITMLLVMAN